MHLNIQRPRGQRFGIRMLVRVYIYPLYNAYMTPIAHNISHSQLSPKVHGNFPIPNDMGLHAGQIRIYWIWGCTGLGICTPPNQIWNPKRAR